MRAALVLLLLFLFAAALANFLHQEHRASADNHAGKQI
jgi:CHASE1-domain containing sensor protein